VGKKWETLVSGLVLDPPVEKVPTSAVLTEVIEALVIEPRRLWWSLVINSMRPTSSVVEIS
jgi:hypothetical protein